MATCCGRALCFKFYGEAGVRGELETHGASSFAAAAAEAGREAGRLRRPQGWLLQFAAPWCRHCQDLRPYFQSAGRRLQAVWGSDLKVGVVNCDDEGALCREHGVSSYPTIRLFVYGAAQLGGGGGRGGGSPGSGSALTTDFAGHSGVSYPLIPDTLIDFVTGALTMPGS